MFEALDLGPLDLLHLKRGDVIRKVQVQAPCQLLRAAPHCVLAVPREQALNMCVFV